MHSFCSFKLSDDFLIMQKMLYIDNTPCELEKCNLLLSEEIACSCQLHVVGEWCLIHLCVHWFYVCRNCLFQMEWWVGLFWCWIHLILLAALSVLISCFVTSLLRFVMLWVPTALLLYKALLSPDNLLQVPLSENNVPLFCLFLLCPVDVIIHLKRSK